MAECNLVKHCSKCNVDFDSEEGHDCICGMCGADAGLNLNAKQRELYYAIREKNQRMELTVDVAQNQSTRKYFSEILLFHRGFRNDFPVTQKIFSAIGGTKEEAVNSAFSKFYDFMCSLKKPPFVAVGDMRVMKNGVLEPLFTEVDKEYLHLPEHLLNWST
jgi:hypothetical protein